MTNYANNDIRTERNELFGATNPTDTPDNQDFANAWAAAEELAGIVLATSQGDSLAV